jgi:hypothetical protein
LIMTFRLPAFNIVANVWHDPVGIPPAGPPSLSPFANLCVGRRVHLGQITERYTMQLLCPMGTEIRGPEWCGTPDVIEAPAGSLRFYEVVFVDNAGTGFANEHVYVVMKQKGCWGGYASDSGSEGLAIGIGGEGAVGPVLDSGSEGLAIGIGGEGAPPDTGSEGLAIGTGGEVPLPDTGSEGLAIGIGGEGAPPDTGSEGLAIGIGGEVPLPDTGSEGLAIGIGGEGAPPDTGSEGLAIGVDGS